MPSFQKLQVWLKPNYTWMFIGWSSTNFGFFVPIWNSKWRLRQSWLSLTLDPMGKMFQNTSSLKPLGQLKPNCPGMIIGRSSVFNANRKSKMASTRGHSINTGPYGENTEIYSSLKLLHRLNLKCASIIGRSFTNFVFFMLIVIPRWLPLQDIVFT